MKPKRWGLFDIRDENGQVHSVPMWQRKRHDLTLQCECVPELECCEHGDLVKHNVFTAAGKIKEREVDAQ